MKALLKFARSGRSSGDDDEVVSDGSTHLKMLEAMKKEFRLLRILWRQGPNSIEKKLGLSFGLKNGLRFQFDSVTCLNYPFLQFSQYNKSQMVFQTVFQTVFETVF